jgi:hypothetical protein
LNAYQENSKLKVEDLFSYFQMLDASLNDDLKKEVVKTSICYFKIPMQWCRFYFDSLINSVATISSEAFLISEPILFSVSDESKYGIQLNTC